MGAPYTPYFQIPREPNETGIADAITFNAAMDFLDGLLFEGAGFGDKSWAKPVADFASLPATGNEVGDVRQTLDTGSFYRWDGVAWKPAIAREVVDQISTGWLSGGEVTRAGGLDLNVAAGTGVHNDNAGVIKTITWGAAVLSMPANSLKNVVVDSAGVVSLEDPPANFIDEVTLGTAHSDVTSVVLFSKHNADVTESIGRLHRYFADVIGAVSVIGGVASPSSVPLRIDVSPGTYYLSDYKVSVIGVAPITFTYWYQDGSGGWITVPAQTVIDTANYDGGGGALIPVPGGEYKKDLLFIGYSDDGVEYHIVYSQETFTSQVDAERGPIPVAPFEIVLGTARSGGVVVLSGAAVLASVVDHRVFLGQQTQALSGPVDHGGLSGLSHDDHPQYLLADGTRAMAGNLNMGGNNVVSVGLVDGVSISSHVANGSAHHIRYSDTEADARIALHAAISAAHHTRPIDGELLPALHGASHQNGQPDEISVNALSGTLADPQLPNAPTEASATATTTTTGAADGLLAGMTLTPGAGNYLVWFSTTVDHDSSNETIWVSLYVNGVQVPHTEREFRRGGSAGNLQVGLSFNAYITGVGAAQDVEVRWRTTAATASAYERTLNLLKVA